eukprot:Plantae.Rhodophyta-Hildenbrandia_rubra.ctg12169.p1 GENE.Plantae.Rhodophyta-Hildenbrandia_rubra.ctg12169~~Plantae.Rhodophyta-Hildenbrandia_rubra.ctg12169.p1  ORF type:complete len:319 (-),score=62.34 Plantae.Rhodophyta-Hildenbrandia_rubra.ctg12169:2437-3393(-)
MRSAFAQCPGLFHIHRGIRNVSRVRPKHRVQFPLLSASPSTAVSPPSTTLPSTTSTEKRSQSTFSDIKRYIDGPFHSEVVVHNGVAYVSGQLSFKTRGKPVADQTREVLKTIDGILESAGTDKSRLLSATIYLGDIGTIGEMEVAWGEWIDKENKPARSVVQARLVRDYHNVEIAVTAAVSKSRNNVGVIETSEAAAAVGPYVQGVRVENGTVYASGCIGLDPKTGEFAGVSVEEQTRQALENAKHILKAGGVEVKDIVRTLVLVSDIGEYGKVNGVYKEFFESQGQGGPLPARSLFAVKDLPKGALVEIECTALESS